jgi:hypothetical protein
MKGLVLSIHEIQIDLHSGETLKIARKVKRFHTDISPNGLIYKKSIKIIYPPKQNR